MIAQGYSGGESRVGKGSKEQYYEVQPNGATVSKVYKWRTVNRDGTYGPGGDIQWVAWSPKPKRLLEVCDDVAQARRIARAAKP
jgi:hypothetical protein